MLSTQAKPMQASYMQMPMTNSGASGAVSAPRPGKTTITLQHSAAAATVFYFGKLR